LIQYLAHGGGVIDPEGNPTLDRDALADVLDFYNDAVTSGVISPTLVLQLEDADQSWERFLAGEDGLTVVRTVRYWREADETMAAAPIPSQTGDHVSIARGWTITMVASDPARQALAMLLFDWLIAPDHSARWTQAEGYVPATQSALLLWNLADEDRAVLRGILLGAVPLPPPEVMETIGPILQEALESVLRGRATPRRAADAAIEKLEL
jgi:ABC-type glycerol-3-phosphate transport system substrate-binding protein